MGNIFCGDVSIDFLETFQPAGGNVSMVMGSILT